MTATQRAVSTVQLSGYDLVKSRPKSRGKLATAEDYAEAIWKPWKPDPSGTLRPTNEELASLGKTMRVGLVIMCKSRDDLIAMNQNLGFDTIDELLANLLQSAESLKEAAAMLEGAYARVLACACAHDRGGRDKKRMLRA